MWFPLLKQSRYALTAFLMGVPWFLVLHVPPGTRNYLYRPPFVRVGLALNVVFVCFMMCVASLAVALCCRRWIVRTSGWRSVFPALFLPFFGMLVFIWAVPVVWNGVTFDFRGLTGSLGSRDFWILLPFWGTLTTVMSIYVVFPMGLISQFVMARAGAAEGLAAAGRSPDGEIVGDPLSLDTTQVEPGVSSVLVYAIGGFVLGFFSPAFHGAIDLGGNGYTKIGGAISCLILAPIFVFGLGIAYRNLRTGLIGASVFALTWPIGHLITAQEARDFTQLLPFNQWRLTPAILPGYLLVVFVAGRVATAFSSDKRVPTSGHRGVFALSLVGSLVVFALYGLTFYWMLSHVAQQRAVTRTMLWSIDSEEGGESSGDKGCFKLEHIEYPGRYMTLCDEEAHARLKTLEGDRVEVEFLLISDFGKVDSYYPKRIAGVELDGLGAVQGHGYRGRDGIAQGPPPFKGERFP